MKEWIEERMRMNKAYIIREKMGIRKHLRNKKKVVAAWFYQLLIGHAIIAHYFKNELKKRDSEECW
jgi:hypothetical protein